MKILIAGGSGLIGKELINVLQIAEHDIAVLTRSPQEVDLPAGVEPVGWDAETTEGWGYRAAWADAIINLAGANIGARPWTNERKRIILESRQNAGRAIVDAVRQAEKKPAVVLQIAGVGYYGPQDGNLIDEQAPPGDDYLANVGVDWENSTRPVAEMGIRHVVMRAGVVLSPEGGALKPFLLQHRMFSGGPLGSGKQWISWIHPRDLVRSIQFFLDRDDTSGVFNVTSPEPVTNAEFGRTLGKIMRRPYWFPIPAFALYAVLGEMSTVVLTGQRVHPKRLLEMGFQFEFSDLRRALMDLLQKA
jgi:uncharacterized protein